MVKSGIFGQTAKFGQPLCLFHGQIIGIKTKLSMQTMKILMRRLIRSRPIWISTVCKRVSEFTWCPSVPDFTLVIALSVWIDRSGGCVDLDRCVSVGVGLSGQHCTRPLDKCA